MNLDEIVEKFVKTINKHDADAVCELITDDHEFIDSGGERYKGIDAMRKGWSAYFTMMPDYKIDIADIFVSDNTVVMFGKASATYSIDGKLRPENYWEIPAAWRAKVENSKVKEWQVFADLEPVRKIIKRNSK